MTTDAPPQKTYSAQETADMCRVSKKTILRKANELAAAGAYKDGKGEWRITAVQMMAVKLNPGEYQPHDPLAVLPDEDTPTPTTRSMSPIEEALLAEYRAMLAEQRQRIASLEDQLAVSEQDRVHWRTQHAVAEAVAEERALTMNDLRRDRQLLVEQMKTPRGLFRRKQITVGTPGGQMQATG